MEQIAKLLTLRGIEKRYLRLFDAYNAEETTDEEREYLERELLSEIKNLGKLADAFAEMISVYELLAEQAKKEEERLTELRKRRENAVKRMNEWLGRILWSVNKGKTLTTDLHEYPFRDSIETVIIDATKIPLDLMRPVPETYEPNKTAIKDRILSRVIKRYGTKKPSLRELTVAIENGLDLRTVKGAMLKPKHTLHIK